jgi:hypothetical protein
MPYQIVYDDKEDCSYVAATGAMNVEDYKSLFLEAWGRQDYINSGCAVWDFRECQMRLDTTQIDGDFGSLSRERKKQVFAELAMEAVQDLAAFTRNHRPTQLPSRIAVVTGNDVDFGMTRVYHGFAGLEPEDLRVFKSIDSARHWSFD